MRIVAVVVAALVLAPGAGAKWLAPAEICGARACVKAGKQEALAGLGDLPYSSTAEVVSAPSARPYYELRGGGRPAFVVPSANAIRVGFNWYRLDERSRAALAAIARRLRPRPVPEVTSVTVAGRRASAPAAYGPILGDLPKAEAPVHTRRVAIVLRSAQRSPWTNGESDVSYIPGAGILHRHGEWVRAPKALARQLERDLGLSERPDRRKPKTYLAAFGLALAGAGVLWLNRRGRRRVRRYAS